MDIYIYTCIYIHTHVDMSLSPSFENISKHRKLRPLSGDLSEYLQRKPNGCLAVDMLLTGVCV